MESQLNGWISLVGGIVLTLAGVILLEPILLGIGVVMILVTWGTFRLRKRTRDRYKA